MAVEPYTFDEEGIRRVIASVLREESKLQTDQFFRRRRHVTLLGGRRGGLQLLRLEEDLCNGLVAPARLVGCDGLTLSGEIVTVRDMINKAFARGTDAPTGDEGGDEQGDANFVYGSFCDGEYHYVHGGSYYTHIEGTLSEDQLNFPWRANVADIFGSDGEFLYGGEDGQGSITLNGVCGITPTDGAYFKAQAWNCGQYSCYVYCCDESV